MNEEIQPPKMKASWWRFLVIIMASLLLFGNMYAFDNPQALEDSIEIELDITEVQFNLLYAYFSLPNIATCLVIGIVIDKIGVKISVVILSLGVAISQLLISIGVSIRSFPMMLACRALFGICSESLITAQISLVSFWFKGKELATALGLIITLPELGGALNSFLTPIIYENTGSLSAGFYVGTAFCIFSFLCGCVLYWIEWRAEKEQKGFVGHVEVKTIKCEDMKQFNMKVWIIIAIGSLAAALYVPFMDNANRFYQKRFCYTQVDAGNAVMWIYLSAIITSIPLGLMIDKLGGRVYFFIGTMVAFLIAHLIYLFLPNCISDQIKGALSGSFFLGLGYSMYSNCVVPLFPLMVKSSIMGTAIGLLATFENIAESIVPELSSLIVHSQESEQTGYRLSELFYCGLAVIGVLVAMLMFCYRKTCHRLNQVVCEELGDAYSSEAQAASNVKKFEEFKPEQDQQSQGRLDEPFMHGLGLTNQDL